MNLPCIRRIMNRPVSAGWITRMRTTASSPGCGPTSWGPSAGGGLQLHPGAAHRLPSRGAGGPVAIGWCSTPTASITGAATMMWVWSSSPRRPLAGDGTQPGAGLAAARDLVHQTGVLMFEMENGWITRLAPVWTRRAATSVSGLPNRTRWSSACSTKRSKSWRVSPARSARPVLVRPRARVKAGQRYGYRVHGSPRRGCCSTRTSC